jgi:hypothetical protein
VPFCTFSYTELQFFNLGNPVTAEARFVIHNGVAGCTLPGSNAGDLLIFDITSTAVDWNLIHYYPGDGLHGGPPVVSWDNLRNIGFPLPASVLTAADFWALGPPTIRNVYDANGANPRDIVIRPPLCMDTTYITSVNTPITATAVASIGSGPGPLVYGTVTAPIHGTLSGSYPDRIYTPSLDFVGTDSYQFTVNDGALDAVTPGTNTIIVQQPFSLTSVDPVFGPTEGDTFVTLVGIGFDAGTTFSFDSLPATSVHIISSVLATARTPAHAVGAVTVGALRSTGEVGMLVDGYTYYHTPNLNGLPPWQTQGQWALHRLDLSSRKEGPSGNGD